MNAVSFKPGSSALRIGARAVTVGGSYLVTAIIVLAVVVLLRRQVAPAVLRDALSFFFIASLAAGLEPATVKAALLRTSAGEVAANVGVGACLAVSAIKALAAAPFLALLWRFADPDIEPRDYLWLPLVAVAGFAATDLRVLYDVRGRHALAIWLKQGSLGGGLVALAALLWAGVPLFWAMGVSTAPRLVLIVVAALAEPRREGGRRLAGEVGWLLADARWLELAVASVIAAVGGSADRVLALRYLAPAAYAAYYLLYEGFSRFWLLPYLLGPIVFARRAAGQAADLLIRRSWMLTAAAGAGFVSVTALVLALAPALLAHLVGADFGPAVLAFAAAVVLNAFTQLRMADLQGSGATRRAAIVAGLSAVVSIAVFYAAVRAIGASGLLIAWLVKSALELAAVLAIRPPRRA